MNYFSVQQIKKILFTKIHGKYCIQSSQIMVRGRLHWDPRNILSKCAKYHRNVHFTFLFNFLKSYYEYSVILVSNWTVNYQSSLNGSTRPGVCLTGWFGEP